MPITTTVSAVLDLYFFIRMFSFVSTPVSFTALRLNLISWSVGLDGWLCCNLYTEGRRESAVSVYGARACVSICVSVHLHNSTIVEEQRRKRERERQDAPLQ